MDKENLQPPEAEENREQKLPENDNRTAAATTKPEALQSPKPVPPEEKGKDETIGIP